jgi:hypothetical protein
MLLFCYNYILLLPHHSEMNYHRISLLVNCMISLLGFLISKLIHSFWVV